MGRLEGKIAVITGASRGIGRAVALAFAREGAVLAVTGARDREALDAVERELSALGTECLARMVDVGRRTEVDRLVREVEERWGRLDILVNNAGVLTLKRFEDITEEQWDETIRVHLKGTFNGMQAALPIMKRQRSGKIINLTGPAALRPSNGVSDYASAKGGIITLTFNVANEMKPHNIQINCISPIADTRMTDAIADFREREGIPDVRPNPAPAETVAPAFVFFASSDSDYITGEVLGFHRK
ncbi:MAG: SDR family NAD(P)-dependent oxidoreductase [Deltaproteobacteria bacterium]|nr:SDR family NAD(P)-dependent oxidoreductase [Deltaproteobacteria bacterium]